jgi:hypothetical protein
MLFLEGEELLPSFTKVKEVWVFERYATRSKALSSPLHPDSLFSFSLHCNPYPPPQPADIVDGNLKVILGLIWRLVLNFQVMEDGGAPLRGNVTTRDRANEARTRL